MAPRAASVAFGCRCGAVEGVLDPRRRVDHLVCYCPSCRAFSRLCGGDALDAGGGTTLFETTLGAVRIDRGRDRLAALRMSARGPVRWSCGDCDAAIASTISVPVLPLGGIVGSAIRGDRAPLGPVRGAVFARHATGEPQHRPIGLAGVTARFLWHGLQARSRGEHQRSPFHGLDGRPITTAPVIDAALMQALSR